MTTPSPSFVGEQLSANIFPIDQLDRSLVYFAEASLDIARPRSLDLRRRLRIKTLDHHARQRPAIVGGERRCFPNELADASSPVPPPIFALPARPTASTPLSPPFLTT